MDFTFESVVSKDGTVIGYWKIGSGPGLIICHGAGRISQSYRKLALALSDRYTVFIPDRRGRGLSGPALADYDMGKATEDLSALLKATGADFVFGHSSGGLVTLETGLVYPIKKIAVYEPPVSINHSLPSEWLADFEKAVEKKQLKKAMAISLRGLRAHEAIVKMPYWCLMILINVLCLAERKKEKGTRMLDLLHTVPSDMKMAVKLDSTYQRYENLESSVLVMSGRSSTRYFQKGSMALTTVIRDVDFKIFEEFDHYSPEEKVTEIGAVLKDFFQ